MNAQPPSDGWQSEVPPITLHVLTGSHPCNAVELAFKSREIPHERVELALDGTHAQKTAEIYGEGRQTLPGMLVEEERVHGSTAIFERLNELLPEELSLYPSPHSEEIREVEIWGNEHFQQLGRRLTWGALYFKPYAAAQSMGGEPLNPEATDFMMRFVRGTWKHHGITSVLVAKALTDLPGDLDRIDELIDSGVLGQSEELPNAADMQLSATLSLLLTIGDVREQIERRPCARLAELTGLRPGLIPAGAFPEHWMPG